MDFSDFSDFIAAHLSFAVVVLGIAFFTAYMAFRGERRDHKSTRNERSTVVVELDASAKHAAAKSGEAKAAKVRDDLRKEMKELGL